MQQGKGTWLRTRVMGTAGPGNQPQPCAAQPATAHLGVRGQSLLPRHEQVSQLLYSRPRHAQRLGAQARKGGVPHLREQEAGEGEQRQARNDGACFGPLLPPSSCYKQVRCSTAPCDTSAEPAG